MADLPHKSVREEIRENLRAYQRLLSANGRSSNAEPRRNSEDLIRRLELMIADQEDRMKKLQHPSGGSLSQTRRLRVSMQDALATYRSTLQQIRQSAQTLELSCAILESL